MSQKLTVQTHVMLTKSQSAALTMLREAGIVSADVLRQAIDAALLQYLPVLKQVNESRARAEQLSALGIIGRSHHRAGTKGGML